MKRLSASVFTAFVLLVSGLSASAQPEQDRRELMTLYFASIAADRCDFPLTEEEADKLVRGASDLQKKLKLSDQAADVLYEEVEMRFEKTLPDACKPESEGAKSYAQVLERIRRGR
ncbi:MAG: hypothetical protein AB7O79_13655 [Xanthobacteraceae bacterium]